MHPPLGRLMYVASLDGKRYCATFVEPSNLHCWNSDKFYMLPFIVKKNRRKKNTDQSRKRCSSEYPPLMPKGQTS
jgi:hypothetical protein